MRNVLVAWLGQAFSVLLSFVTRSVFAHLLAMEYMGLENLFSNVLTILSLAELGVGSAIVFSLYEPLAKNDTAKIKSLMRLFKRAYQLIGTLVAILGFILSFFIPVLIKEAPDIPYLNLYFLCFVANTSVSYFFASYKGALIMADQKKYLVSLIQYGGQILMCAAQIAVLFLTRNYFLFLFCMIGSTILQNFVTWRLADRMYPYLKEKNVDPVDPETLTSIKKNVFALVLHRMAGVANSPASSLIISTFVGINAIAVYGNYMLVYNSLSRILDQTFDAITAPIGNLGVSESSERQYEVFKTCFFVNALLYAIVSSGLLCLFNPFVALFFGENYLFPMTLVVLIVLMFFLRGLRTAALTFTNAYGLFWHTRWKAVIETIVMLAASLVLVQYFEIAGVIVANIVSIVCVASVYEGHMLYKHGLHRSSRAYFVKFYLYFFVSFALAALSFAACGLIPGTGIVSFLAKGVVSVAVPLAGFIVMFRKTCEFAETASLARRVVGKMAGKFKKS